MFHYQKNFVEKKVSGEISFDAISLFHVEIQEPKRHSTTTRAFVFPAKFHYHKFLSGDYELKTSLPPDFEHPMELLSDVHQVSKSGVSSFSMTGDI